MKVFHESLLCVHENEIKNNNKTMHIKNKVS